MTTPAEGADVPWTADETKRIARFGAAMFDVLFERFCEGDWEIEINDLITHDALKAGLVECVDFDPDEHLDNSDSCEPGDDYYVITDLGRKARRRKAHGTPSSEAEQGA